MGRGREVRDAQTGSSSRFRFERRLVLCFCIVSALWIGILYHAALGAPFVYDDLDQIANNPALDCHTSAGSTPKRINSGVWVMARSCAAASRIARTNISVGMRFR